MRRRLLVVANRFAPQVGGAELVTLNIVQGLAIHFDVDVVTPLRDDAPRTERRDGFTVFRAWNLHNPVNRLPYLRAEALCPTVFTRLLSGAYDLVHCFPALNRNNQMALLGANLKRIPIFLTNYDAFDYALLLTRGGAISDTLEQLTLTPRQRWQLKRFNAVFTISRRETAMISEVNPNTFLSTVPAILEEHDREVDVEAFRQKYLRGYNGPVILCLSRVAHIKGQDLLLSALPYLREKLPRFVVLIVGRSDFEPDYYRQLQAYVQNNNLEEHVCFTGPLSRDEALASFRVCDVHVFPMRFMNSGAVVVETWAARKPVLLSNMVDPNYVVEGENGFTFDVADPQDLCEKLVLMLRDREHCQIMGANGRRLVEEKFQYPHLIRQYMAAYEEHGGVSCSP